MLKNDNNNCLYCSGTKSFAGAAIMRENKWKEIFGSEWTYIAKLGSAIVDPEEKRSFWEHVRAKKRENERWSIYDDFPRSECATKRAMRECCERIRGLRRESASPEPAEEVSEMRKLLGEIIEIGGHEAELCPWPRKDSA